MKAGTISRWPEASVLEKIYLTAEEVSERYRGEIAIGTLRNWRAARIGPPFVKIGKAILYPIDELDIWERSNLVTCRANGAAGNAHRDRL